MKLILRLAQELTNTLYELRARVAKIKPSIDMDVPYVCQFATPEHAEPSLKNKLEARNDPSWQETGALSPERYAQWAFTMCGMASAAMALSHITGSAPRAAELAEDALQHGVYVDEKGIISSMRYREFVPWIRTYGISAEVYSRLSLRGIQYALSNGRLVIASVNPNIRGFATAPIDQKGGHLVLVTGYNIEEKTVTINNPSGFTSTDTQHEHTLSDTDFLKYFAGRGITLSETHPH